MKAWVNGVETSHIAVYDRGIQYGDGLFETMRVTRGSIKFWPQHLARLRHGCQRLSIDVDSQLLEQQLDTIQAEGMSGVIKMIVTRGESDRGYRVDTTKPATIIWMYSDLPAYPAEYYTEGVDVLLCKTTVSRNPVLAGIKHLNRLDNVIARNEWQDEYQEGLMCDDRNHVVEGTMSNVFFVKDEMLLTPDISQCGITGVMRQRLIDIADKEGIPTTVRHIPAVELEGFDAAILTNSLIGAWPIRSIDNRPYRISPIVQHLVSLIQECQN